jgi:hypothetical protein
LGNQPSTTVKSGASESNPGADRSLVASGSRRQACCRGRLRPMFGPRKKARWSLATPGLLKRLRPVSQSQRKRGERNRRLIGDTFFATFHSGVASQTHHHGIPLRRSPAANQFVALQGWTERRQEGSPKWLGLDAYLARPLSRCAAHRRHGHLPQQGRDRYSRAAHQTQIRVRGDRTAGGETRRSPLRTSIASGPGRSRGGDFVIGVWGQRRRTAGVVAWGIEIVHVQLPRRRRTQPAHVGVPRAGD